MSRVLRHPLLLSLPSFFVLSLWAFRHDAPYLFYGLDGRFEVSLITLGTLFTPPRLDFTSDFFHGLGNIWFTVNPWLLPEYRLALSAPGEFTHFARAYAIAASELFLATYLVGRFIGVARLTALIAAWMLPLLTFQYAGWNLVPSTFRAFPHYATIAGISTVTSALLLLLGRAAPRKAVGLGALVFCSVTYVVIVAPTLLILAAPQFAVFAAVALWSGGSRQKRIVALAVLAGIAAVSISLGYLSFLLGLTSYTAANVFRELSIRPGSLQEASLLFWEPFRPHFFTVERSFILLGLHGALWALVRTGAMIRVARIAVITDPALIYGSAQELRVLRLAAVAFLVTALGYIAVGVAHAIHPFWFGPALWYFEDFLLPYHALFAAFLIADPLRILWRIAATPTQRRAMATALAALIAALPWAFVIVRQHVVGPPNLPYYAPYPERETPITRILKDEIALSPGAPFRGRAATLTGRIFPKTANIDIVGLSGIPDVLAMLATGNAHSMAGLWQDRIPALIEYNPLMTPPYFVFNRVFFTEPADRQIRNILAMRRIDPRVLAAVGVRFVVTDAPFAGARLRQTIAIPVPPGRVESLGIHQAIPSFALYLYELGHVNLGQYSPTEIRVVPTASAELDVLADPAVDLAHTAVSAEPVEGPLVPATAAAFTVDDGFYSVKASSPGRSVILLPLEYSRCLRLNGGAAAKMFRADLLLTGIAFEGKLDAKLIYRTGPFVAAGCRLDDARDMQRLDIRHAFAHRPALAPVAILSY